MINTEQHEVIGWRDPSEVVENTPTRDFKPRKGTPCFSVSCMSDASRQKIVDQIKALNGKVSDSEKYESTLTHYVCEKPKRSERMLSCVAAGKWVVGLDFIEKSYEAKRFLNVSPKSNNMNTLFHFQRKPFNIFFSGEFDGVMLLSYISAGRRI